MNLCALKPSSFFVPLYVAILMGWNSRGVRLLPSGSSVNLSSLRRSSRGGVLPGDPSEPPGEGGGSGKGAAAFRGGGENALCSSLREWCTCKTS